jgi:hypothetical protein
MGEFFSLSDNRQKKRAVTALLKNKTNHNFLELQQEPVQKMLFRHRVYFMQTG